MQFQQVAETDPAWLILTHRPSMEIWLGSTHPSGSLYETGVSETSAVHAHETFVAALKSLGPRVVTIGEILCSAPRDKLVSLAMNAMSYEFRGRPSSLSPKEDLPLFSEEYKRDVLSHKTADELVSIIFTQPTVILTKGDHEGLIVDSVALKPLSNLVFARDQQIVTGKGLVFGALKNEQRRNERRVLELCFEMLGVPRVGAISGDGTLEGGDFLPFSEDLAFLGLGIRTNFEAARQLMKRDLIGARRLALVSDTLDRQQARMHLDTVFNIVDEHHVVVWEPAINDPTKKRFVDLHVHKPSGGWELDKFHVDFVDFLRSEGLAIIPATVEEQAAYLVNFLNLGRVDGPDKPVKILSVHPGLAEKLATAGVKDVEVIAIDYRGITRMYGAAHCSSQVFRCHGNGPCRQLQLPIDQQKK